MRSTRMNLWDNEDFSIDLEYTEDFFIVHLPRLEPTVGAYKHLLVKGEEIKEFARTIGYTGIYTAIDPNDKHMPILLNKLGATFRGVSENMHVYSYEEF